MSSALGHPAMDSRYDTAVLVSGGLDSAVLLRHVQRELDGTPIAVHFSGLSSPTETTIASTLAADIDVAFWSIDLSSFLLSCRSKLVDHDGSGERLVFGAATLYSAALAYTIAHGIAGLAIGLHRDDAAAYVEQTPAFLEYIRQGLHLVGSRVQIIVPSQD